MPSLGLVPSRTYLNSVIYHHRVRKPAKESRSASPAFRSPSPIIRPVDNEIGRLMTPSDPYRRKKVQHDFKEDASSPSLLMGTQLDNHNNSNRIPIVNTPLCMKVMEKEDTSTTHPLVPTNELRHPRRAPVPLGHQKYKRLRGKNMLFYMNRVREVYRRGLSTWDAADSLDRLCLMDHLDDAESTKLFFSGLWGSREELEMFLCKVLQAESTDLWKPFTHPQYRALFWFLCDVLIPHKVHSLIAVDVGITNIIENDLIVDCGGRNIIAFETIVATIHNIFSLWIIKGECKSLTYAEEVTLFLKTLLELRNKIPVRGEDKDVVPPVLPKVQFKKSNNVTVIPPDSSTPPLESSPRLPPPALHLLSPYMRNFTMHAHRRIPDAMRGNELSVYGMKEGSRPSTTLSLSRVKTAVMGQRVM
eukprot:PhF_6_TR33026/c0_g1_i1/m.48681